jgi:hypothetical protein
MRQELSGRALDLTRLTAIQPTQAIVQLTALIASQLLSHYDVVLRA